MGNFCTPDSMVTLILTEIAFIYVYLAFHINPQNHFHNHHKSQSKQWKCYHITIKNNLIRKIQLKDTYLIPNLVSWNGIYMGLRHAMTTMCYITNGIRITISWNIAIRNIYKCTNLTNKIHPTETQINFNINKDHYTHPNLNLLHFKSEISINILVYFSNFNCKSFQSQRCLLRQIPSNIINIQSINVLSASKLHNIYIFLIFSMDALYPCT